ncbi:MAG: cytochrome c oxidase subunit II [Solirubrobacterales bacterium]|nr:cytochrome c oxidase subunit II [Solirubrobacterales bacterium]
MIPRALNPGRPPHRTRLLSLAIVAGLLAALALAPTAFADFLTPESGGSPNADKIDSLYKITLAVGIVIFLLVEGVLIWTLVKYRARRGGPKEGAQIHGNTQLEVGWTVGAAVIVVVLAVVTFIYLPDIENPPASGPNGLAAGVEVASIDQPAPPPGPSEALTIDVNGQQYLWRYDYPGGAFSYYEMVVPTDTTVVLNLTASDVIHSWWIPKLGGKMDAVPGFVNKTWFKISKPGVYIGQCAELCGSGHADMRARVRAVSPDEYLAFLERQKADFEAAREALAEQRELREAAGETELQ